MVNFEKTVKKQIKLEVSRKIGLPPWSKNLWKISLDKPIFSLEHFNLHSISNKNWWNICQKQSKWAFYQNFVISWFSHILHILSKNSQNSQIQWSDENEDVFWSIKAMHTFKKVIQNYSEFLTCKFIWKSGTAGGRGGRSRLQAGGGGK